MNILIAGATGLIGRVLLKELLALGHHVIVLTRNVHNASKLLNFANGEVVFTDYKTGWQNNSIDIVINLAGSPITKVWTPQQKKRVINSRLLSTDYIYIRCQQNKIKPKLWITVSSTGYYGDKGDTEITEKTSTEQKGFLQLVAGKIESNAKKINSLVERHCIVRVGIVLDRHFGILGKLLPFYKFHLGGKIGSGNQFVPWIHVNDVVSSFIYLINNEQCSGVYNIAAPNACRQKDFSNSLAKAMHKLNFMWLPSLFIKFIMGKRSALILNSQNVKPTHLLDDGFSFTYSEIGKALDDIFNSGD